MSANTGPMVFRSALAFFSGTFLSRASGLLRDMAMAFFFGATAEVAAFMVAFRFANLLRRLLAESPLTASFIPLFEERVKLSPKEGGLFFRDFFYHLMFVLSIIVLITEIGLWSAGNLLTMDSRQILGLTTTMLPSLIFIGLFGLNNAYLQCQNRFFIAGSAPIFFNLVWIGCVVFFRRYPPSIQIHGLSLGIIAAFGLQWIFTVIPVYRTLIKTLSVKEILQPCWCHENIKKAVKPFLLGILGIGAMQINSALDAFFARMVSLEGPAYLWYAIRVQQIPLAFIGIALSSALMPVLARNQGDDHVQKNIFRSVLGQGLLLGLFAQTGIFVLAHGIIAVLFGYGRFGPNEVVATTKSLWAYAGGILPGIFVLFLSAFFHARQVFAATSRSALAAVFANILLNIFFIYVLKLGVVSIATATSIATALQVLYLLKRMPFSLRLQHFIAKAFAVAMLSAGATLLFGYVCFQDPTWLLWMGYQESFLLRGPAFRCISLIAQGGVFTVVFFVLSKLLGVFSFTNFRKYLMRPSID